MIQARRGMQFLSQDEIGYQLGLIVPINKAHLFTKVRTGKAPVAGRGTQTSLEEFSISTYFKRNDIPLRITTHAITEIENLSEFISSNLRADHDIIVCYNSRLLFKEGDLEHVSLVQEIDFKTKRATLIDPAIGTPKVRIIKLSKLEEVLRQHAISKAGGFWVISRCS